MNHPTHSVFAAACWAGGCAITHPGPAILTAGALTAATVAPWPDIDNLGAWSRRKRRRITVRQRRGHTIPAVKVRVIRWRKHPVKSRVSRLVCLFGDHREGPCHSLLILAATAALFAAPMLWLPWWPPWLPAATATGLCSHPILDLMNRRPVRIFWPLGRLWYGLGIRVGGPGEAITALTLTTALIPLAWLALGGNP